MLVENNLDETADIVAGQMRKFSDLSDPSYASSTRAGAGGAVPAKKHVPLFLCAL